MLGFYYKDCYETYLSSNRGILISISYHQTNWLTPNLISIWISIIEGLSELSWYQIEKWPGYYNNYQLVGYLGLTILLYMQEAPPPASYHDCLICGTGSIQGLRGFMCKTYSCYLFIRGSCVMPDCDSGSSRSSQATTPRGSIGANSRFIGANEPLLAWYA